MKYECRFYYGDYYHRQDRANEDNAILYVEQRFNSFSKKSNYTLVKVSDKASERTIEFAKEYSARVSKGLGIPLYEKDISGVIVTRRGGRGDNSLRKAKMPAVILEPLFVSNPEHVQLFWNGGREILADILANTIRDYFPEGGLIAFSVGHRYQRSKPFDQGAHCWGAPEFSEASLAEQVLWCAKFFLEHDLGLEFESEEGHSNDEVENQEIPSS